MNKTNHHKFFTCTGACLGIKNPIISKNLLVVCVFTTKRDMNPPKVNAEVKDTKESEETKENEEEDKDSSKPNIDIQIISTSDENDCSLWYKAVAINDGTLLFSAYDITDTYVTDDKSVVCVLIRDEVEDIPLLKVSHKIGAPGITICSPAGFLIGESVTALKLGCCSIKPTYTLLSRFGKQLLILKGKLKCCGCPPTYKIHIIAGGNNGRDLAEVKVDPTFTESCDILFTKAYIGENSRNLIIGMTVGILLQGRNGDPLTI